MQLPADELGLSFVKFGRRNGVAWIALNRPEHANSVTDALSKDALTAVRAASQHTDVGCLVITGIGRHFCAGADLHELNEFLAARSPTDIEPFNLREIHPLTSAIYNFPFPVVAAVNGAATAGGLDLACACDIRIAADSARFGETYIRMGLPPANGGSLFLPQLVGRGMAAELAFTGDIIDASHALGICLVNRVVPQDQLLSATGDLAERIAGWPRSALAATKRALRHGYRQTLEDNLEEAYFMMGLLSKGEDHLEAVKAFNERRDPEFKQRTHG